MSFNYLFRKKARDTRAFFYQSHRMRYWRSKLNNSSMAH